MVSVNEFRDFIFEKLDLIFEKKFSAGNSYYSMKF